MSESLEPPAAPQEGADLNKKFDELPDHIRQHLIGFARTEFIRANPDTDQCGDLNVEKRTEISRQAEMAWGRLAPATQEEFIRQTECYDDPQFAKAREYYWSIGAKISEIRMKIREAESLVTRGLPSEEKLKQEQISALNRELSQLEESWIREYEGQVWGDERGLMELPTPLVDSKDSIAPTRGTTAPETENEGKAESHASSTHHKIQNRTRILDAEIALAKKAVEANGLDPEDQHCVWTEMIKLAENKFGCWLEVCEGEIKYRAENGIKFFKKGALQKRLNNSRNKCR